MKFCGDCGKPVSHRIPQGDDRKRYVCDQCKTVHYQNPRVVVGGLPIFGEKVLMCRRAIQPGKGYWTLPAGFMENGEINLEGAVRETWEEARAILQGETLYRLIDLPHINQVYVFYRGELLEGAYAVGPESQEVALFGEQEIPWDEIAFSAVTDALKDFFADRRRQHFPVRFSGHRQSKPAIPSTQRLSSVDCRLLMSNSATD